MENLKLLFREQWWGANCFSTLDGNNLEQKIASMSKIAQEFIQALKESDVNAKFVPNEEDRKVIAKIARALVLEGMWHAVIENAGYTEKKVAYKSLGYILFRIRLPKNSSMSVPPSEVRPNHLQQIIMLVWNKLTQEYSGEFKFDQLTPPYVFSVCTGYTPKAESILWTRENVNAHKKEFGLWAELYSGQFEDYREELYEKRVENDISNRQSEVHLINRNSALIYMEPKNYDSFFIKDEETPNSTGYMLQNVINPINKIRTIAFAMIALNNQIDLDMKNLVDETYIKQPLNAIKDDLEKTTRLKNVLQIMLAPFFTEISRSNRIHYSTILSLAVKLNDIENMWTKISQKIESNSQELNAIFNDKQEEVSKKQEKALSMVNLILGAGIVFDIVGYIVPEESGAQGLRMWIGVLFAILLVAFLITYLVKRK